MDLCRDREVVLVSIYGIFHVVLLVLVVDLSFTLVRSLKQTTIQWTTHHNI